MRTRDLAAGGALLALGLAAALMTDALPERTLPNTPGPAFFPWLITIAIITLAILLVARGLVGAPETADTERRAGASPARGLAALGVFVVYLAALPSLGFLLATAPFFAVLMVLFGERRIVVAGIGAIVATAGFYIVFRHGFQIILPQGVLTGLVP